MRLLVAAITFGITIGGLFLFDTTETQNGPEDAEQNYDQIIQELNNQNQIKTPTPKPENKSSKIITKTPGPSPTLPILSPTPSELQNRGSSISQPNSSDLGEIGTTTSPTTTAIPTESIQPTPTPQSTQQNDQITVASLTSPVKQNEPARLDIKTVPQSQCSIKVILPSGSQSFAKGLETKTADNSGTITWSWRINWNTTPGIANIDLVCSKDGQSFSKSLQMQIIER